VRRPRSLVLALLALSAVAAGALASGGCEPSGARPALEVTPDPLDFGAFLWPDVVERTVTVRNRSPRVVYLHKQPSADCSCFALTRPPERLRLEPGESVEMTVSLRSQLAAPGAMRKTLTILSDDPVEPKKTVPITGHMTDVRDVKPREVAFGDVDGKAGIERLVEVRAGGLPGWKAKVTSATSSNERVEATVREVEGGSDLLLRTKKGSVGSLSGQVQLSVEVRHERGDVRTYRDSVWTSGDAR
jgi:hypothetical protein